MLTTRKEEKKIKAELRSKKRNLFLFDWFCKHRTLFEISKHDEYNLCSIQLIYLHHNFSFMKEKWFSFVFAFSRSSKHNNQIAMYISRDFTIQNKGTRSECWQREDTSRLMRKNVQFTTKTSNKQEKNISVDSKRFSVVEFFIFIDFNRKTRLREVDVQKKEIRLVCRKWSRCFFEKSKKQKACDSCLASFVLGIKITTIFSTCLNSRRLAFLRVPPPGLVILSNFLEKIFSFIWVVDRPYVSLSIGVWMTTYSSAVSLLSDVLEKPSPKTFFQNVFKCFQGILHEKL